MDDENRSKIEDMIDKAYQADYNAANDIMNGLLQQKQSDALDQAKISMANQVYNGLTDEPEDGDEDFNMELSDEELDFDDDDEVDESEEDKEE
jgi:hypothetical protein